MTKEFNLPEKDFFTFEEIAERWGRDVSTIEHFIREKKILRPALKFEHVQLPSDNWFMALRDGCDSSEAASYSRLPSVVYVQPRDFKRCKNPDAVSTLYYASFSEFQDFDGNPYWFSSVPPESLYPAREGKAKIKEKLCVARLHTSEVFITREERDRFERKHSSQTDKISGRGSKPERAVNKHDYDPEMQVLANEIAAGFLKTHGKHPTTKDVAAIIKKRNNDSRTVEAIDRPIRAEWREKGR